MNNKNIFLLLIVVLTSAVLVFASTSLNDLERKIADKTKIEKLQVREENGKVILEGLAPTLWDKTKAEKIASKELKSPYVNNIALRSTEKSDRDITLDVSARIQSKSANSYLFDLLAVETHNGEVILKGKLQNAYLRDLAIQGAMETPGARGVIDQIEILPVSAGDDRLRVAVYERLRRDDRLSSYFFSSYPSINIIVDRAHVTLIGSVNTPADKAKAGIIARETSGVLSVDNQLQVE